MEDGSPCAKDNTVEKQMKPWFLIRSFHANPGLSCLHFFFMCENEAQIYLSYHR